VVLTGGVNAHTVAPIMSLLLKITDEMRAAARKLLRNPALKFDVPDRDLLTAIADGKRKLIRAHWWKKHFVVVDRIKLGKLQRLADPARNPNEYERAVAGRKLDAFRVGRPPGMPPEPPPFPKVFVRRKPYRGPVSQTPPPSRGLPAPDGGGVNTKKAAAKATAATGHGGRGGVNTKPKRTGDRHLVKGDRHVPGYMREYMRRRRARLRQDNARRSK
jgi:hypothetical protein